MFNLIYRENDGMIRIYVLLFTGLGALLYHAGPSMILVKYISAILRKIGRFLGIMGTPIRICRKRLKFWLVRVKIALYEQKPIQRIRKRWNEKSKEKKITTRIAMVSITFVVGVLFVGMMGKSVALQNQLSSYDSQIKELDQQIEEEEGRTTEIDDLKEYMKTDEYVEETAREKLGLVKENEIVFKEGDTEENTQDTDSSEGTQNSRIHRTVKIMRILRAARILGVMKIPEWRRLSVQREFPETGTLPGRLEAALKKQRDKWRFLSENFFLRETVFDKVQSEKHL